MWVSATHIPGTQNTEETVFLENSMRLLSGNWAFIYFKKISSIFGKPTLDLFASRINYQIDGYISWKPDSKALAIDSSSIKWNTEFYYIFPPYLAREGESKNLQRQNESHCSDPKMAHTTLGSASGEKRQEAWL